MTAGQFTFSKFASRLLRDTTKLGGVCLLLGLPVAPLVLPADSAGGGLSASRPASTTPLPRQLGFAVAVSGNTAVVSAPGASQAGAAFIYERARAGKPWHLAAPLPDPRHASHDEYAWAVAISVTKSGTYVAVGGNNNNGMPDFVNIYHGSGTHWKLQTTVPDPGPSDEDMFGDSLAISATTLVVGASCTDSDSGDIRIYIHTGVAWHLAASKVDPLDRANDNFGQSVALSGNRILVGSLDRAYVYTHTSGDRFPQTAIIANPGVARANFGYSVALQGQTALIGAPGGFLASTLGPPVSAGAAYLYQLKGKTWTRQAKLTAPADARGDEFGFSVALEQPRLLVGQPLFGKTNCGTAFAFTSSHGHWRERSQITDRPCSSGAKFGFLGRPVREDRHLRGARYQQEARQIRDRAASLT